MKFTKTARTVSLLMVAVELAVNGYAQTSLTSGLVAYYPFNGNAKDESGNGDNGTVFGATLTTDRFTRPNSAFSFDYIGLNAIQATGSHVPRGLASRTFSLWFKQSPRIAGDYIRAPLLSIWDGQSQEVFGIQFFGPSLEVFQKDLVRFTAYDGPNQPMIDGKWHQLVCVVSTNTVLAYIDSKAVVWNALLPPPGTQWNFPQGSLWIGYGPSHYYDGALDEVRVYDRSLSSEEVRELYRAEAPPFTQGLVAYYPFNGNANDESGNGDNGVIVHATLAKDRFEAPGKAYYFDGSSQAGIRALGTHLPTGSKPRTISLWFKPDDLIPKLAPTWISGGLFQYGQPSSGGGVCEGQFVWQRTPRLVSFYLGSEVTWGWSAWLTEWNFAQWHYAVWTYDGGTGALLYVDGRLEAFEGNPPTGVVFDTQSGTLWIGSAGGRYFSGSLDDIRFYNRALSSTEVSQLYEYESGRPTVSVVKAVKPSFSNLSPGTKYQLQMSSDSKTWTNYGAPFTATNTSMVYPQYWDVDDWDSLFFRLQVVP